jgi:hypothetical protein
MSSATQQAVQRVSKGTHITPIFGGIGIHWFAIVSTANHPSRCGMIGLDDTVAVTVGAQA